MTKRRNVKEQLNQPLEDLLTRLNLAPSDQLFMPWSEIQAKFEEKSDSHLHELDFEELSDSYWEMMEFAKQEILRQIKNNLPLTKYIFEIRSSDHQFSSIDRYLNFLADRKKVTQLIHEADHFLKTGQSGMWVPVDELPAFFLTYNFSPTGQFNFNVDPVASALQGVDVNRLLICKVCKRIFWSGRLGKEGCQKKCNQVLRTRKRRQKEKTRFPSRVTQ